MPQMRQIPEEQIRTLYFTVMDCFRSMYDNIWKNYNIIIIL